jgi:hypothetical protein
VTELMGGFEPVDEVEVEVVPAGAATKKHGGYSDEGGQRKDDEGPTIARHGYRVQGRLFLSHP